MGTRLELWWGRSENSALCRFSIDLVPTRPLSLPRYPTTPVHTLVLALVGLLPKAHQPGLVLKVNTKLQAIAVHCTTLNMCTDVQLDFSAKTFGRSKQAKHAGTQYRRSRARKPHSTSSLLDFGCTRLFECVHLLSRL